MSKAKQFQSKQSREKKKAQFSGPDRNKKGLTPILMIILVALLGLAAYLVIGSSSDEPVTSTVASTNQNGGESGTGDVRIPLADVADGKAKFFSYTMSDNKTTRFFALKSSDGVYRAAIDACDTCYHAKKGYRQEGDDMVCNNCGLKFPSARINEVSGGCNPVGLARTIESDHLVIKASELESRGRYFQ